MLLSIWVGNVNVPRLLKKALRDNSISSKSGPVYPGALKLYMKFWISDSYRYTDADLDNFVKGLKDMINGCKTAPTRKKTVRGKVQQYTFQGATPALPLWEDDKKVFEYGEGSR